MSTTPSSYEPRGSATLQDFLAIPEEERFHELIDGEIVRKALPAPEHGDAEGAASQLLRGPFHRKPGGPPDRPGGWWILTEVEVQVGGHVYRPDVAGWRRDRSPERPRGCPVELLPDWICEVISPSNASHDTITKMHHYHRTKVPHYWLIDPRDETLTVYRWQAEGYLRVLGARRRDRVRAEPFEAIEIQVGVFFGDDEEP